jgi:hypothetical protein
MKRAKEEKEEAFYLVKWEGYAKNVDSEVLAIGFYEDVPEDVEEYWKRNQPFNKRVTRAETARANAKTGGRNGRKTRKGKEVQIRKTRKGSLRSPKCPFRTHHTRRRR